MAHGPFGKSATGTKCTKGERRSACKPFRAQLRPGPTPPTSHPSFTNHNSETSVCLQPQRLAWPHHTDQPKLHCEYNRIIVPPGWP